MFWSGIHKYILESQKNLVLDFWEGVANKRFAFRPFNEGFIKKKRKKRKIAYFDIWSLNYWLWQKLPTNILSEILREIQKWYWNFLNIFIGGVYDVIMTSFLAIFALVFNKNNVITKLIVNYILFSYPILWRICRGFQKYYRFYL